MVSGGVGGVSFLEPYQLAGWLPSCLYRDQSQLTTESGNSVAGVASQAPGQKDNLSKNRSNIYSPVCLRIKEMQDIGGVDQYILSHTSSMDLWMSVWVGPSLRSTLRYLKTAGLDGLS